MTHYHIVDILYTNFVYETFLETLKVNQIKKTYGVSRSGRNYYIKWQTRKYTSMSYSFLWNLLNERRFKFKLLTFFQVFV